MPSRKASNSKKTSKNANEAIVNESSAAATAEVKAKPRAARSSRTKKETPAEVPSARGHRKSAVIVKHVPAAESPLVAKTFSEENDTPKAMSAAAGSGFEFASPSAAIIDPVGVVTPAVESSVAPQFSHEDVAKLAYSYWIARGYSHGHNDEDWLRAEAELSGQR
jgi:hypothetical protein